MNQTNNMRRGFTMIELIFVIVIIGILAAVAIPKLAKNRTDAQATICVHESGMLINEVVSKYTAVGFNAFQTLTIKEMTNILDLASGTAGSNHVLTADKVHSTGADYYCDGKKIMNLKAVVSGTEYNLTITPQAGAIASPAAAQAAGTIKKTITNNNASKTITI